MDLTIAISSYGDDSWRELADRAFHSARVQQAVHPRVQLVRIHQPAGTLDTARNAALDACETEWVVHLDADDEVGPGFVEALFAASTLHPPAGPSDLLVPSVSYISPGRSRAPRMPRVAGHTHACDTACMTQGNWMVVGTAARAQMLRDVGGWRDWPMYEDWDLWLRCVAHAGARAQPVPEAVYLAHVRPDSRNRGPSMRVKNATHERIVADVLNPDRAVVWDFA